MIHIFYEQNKQQQQQKYTKTNKHTITTTARTKTTHPLAITSLPSIFEISLKKIYFRVSTLLFKFAAFSTY